MYAYQWKKLQYKINNMHCIELYGPHVSYTAKNKHPTGIVLGDVKQVKNSPFFTEIKNNFLFNLNKR